MKYRTFLFGSGGPSENGETGKANGNPGVNLPNTSCVKYKGIKEWTGVLFVSLIQFLPCVREIVDYFGIF